MDRQLAERMVGAACLLAVLVLAVPAILDGNPDSGTTITHPAVEKDLDLRTHTIRLDGAGREPPVPMPVEARSAPEPASPVDARVVTEPDSPGPVIAKEVPSEVVPAVVSPPAAAPLVASPATAESTKLTAPEAGGDWVVQLGSFSSRGNADRLATAVRDKGFTVAVQGGGGSSGTLFRVRAGPEPDKSRADALAARLAAAGFKGGRVGRQ